MVTARHVWLAAGLVLTLLFTGTAQFAWGDGARVVTQQTFTTPIVLSGEDVGFRVIGRRNDQSVYGELVVRIDGKWVKALGPAGGAGLVPVDK